jgi:hypothetical protein
MCKPSEAPKDLLRVPRSHIYWHQPLGQGRALQRMTEKGLMVAVDELRGTATARHP